MRKKREGPWLVHDGDWWRNEFGHAWARDTCIREHFTFPEKVKCIRFVARKSSESLIRDNSTWTTRHHKDKLFDGFVMMTVDMNGWFYSFGTPTVAHYLEYEECSD